MEQEISLYYVYAIGASITIFLGLLWSFIFDKHTPPTVGEFVAKLAARILFLFVLFAVFMGFLYLAFGVFR